MIKIIASTVKDGQKVEKTIQSSHHSFTRAQLDSILVFINSMVTQNCVVELGFRITYEKVTDKAEFYIDEMRGKTKFIYPDFVVKHFSDVIKRIELLSTTSALTKTN